MSRIRHQSQTERDMSGLAAKREREAAPDDFADEADSRAHDISERPRIRADRPFLTRFEKLEEFKDEAIESFAEIKVSIAEIRGDQKAAATSLRSIEKHLDNAEHKERIAHEAKTEVETAEKKDGIDARKGKRDLWLKVASGVLGGGVLMKILQHLGIL